MGIGIANLSASRLLIVEDQVANTCLLQNILNRLGFNAIESTTDSRKTFTLVETFKPDIIILDLNMPFMDGFAVMQQLGKVPRDIFLPVLVITADSTAQTKRKAMAAGASDYLTKPFDSSEVFVRIRNLLEMRAMHSQLQNQNLILEERVAERTRELKAAQQQMVTQERFRAFGEMAGGIVHDFNNALMSIIGYSELLLGSVEMMCDPATVHQYLTIMNTAGRDASQVIGRLRDFYRPREESDVFTPTNLNDIAEQAVPLTQPKWKDQAQGLGRVVKMELDLAHVPTVMANPAELREVVTNLIFNAVDAMTEGGTITLRTRQEGDDAILEISDTGKGMTEEVRQRCMEPFFSTKGEQGTGLGLSMVFGIIKRHEGTVDLQTTLGVGTTFSLKFPSTLQTVDSTKAVIAHVERVLRVLVVDDESVTRDVISMYLRADGHDCVTAANANEALKCMQNDVFDLLLTDHGMSGMTGLELAATVRYSSSDQPIILMTGFAEVSTDPDNRPPGVDLVIRKPILQSDLRSALLTVFRGFAKA